MTNATWPIAELRRRLAERMEDVAPHMLCDLRRESRELVGRGIATGTKYKVVLLGRKRGFVLDCSAPFERGRGRRGGHLFNVVVAELAGGDVNAGIAAAVALLGLRKGAAPVRRRDPEVARREAEARERAMQADAARRRDKALAIWRAAQEMTEATSAWHYLAGRYCAVKSDALRASVVWHPYERVDMPAMVAAVILPAGGFVGVHVTYLARHGDGWRKAAIENAKLTFGPIPGGIIPLLRGATGLRIDQARHDEDLLLAEGIENALCAALELPGLRTWAGLNVGNLRTIAIPLTFRCIRLVRDRDSGNPRAIKPVTETRNAMIARWQREGRSVLPIDPPRPYKDIAEWRAAKCQVKDPAVV